MLKMKLNSHDQYDRVCSVTKTRQDNYVTDSTSTVYVKKKTELSWPIEPDAIYDEN